MSFWIPLPTKWFWVYGFAAIYVKVNHQPFSCNKIRWLGWSLGGNGMKIYSSHFYIVVIFIIWFWLFVSIIYSWIIENRASKWKPILVEHSSNRLVCTNNEQFVICAQPIKQEELFSLGKTVLQCSCNF